MRFRAPANVFLRRAQVTLVLAALVPTVLMIAVGIVLLAIGGSALAVMGILITVFCTTAIVGYIIGSIFLSRGASMARVQNDFLSSVSHELRTPLTSMKMFIDTLRDDRLTDADEQRKCLDLLHREMERLEELVDRLLELSRMESGAHAFDREPVAIDVVIQDALHAFDAQTLDNRVHVEVKVEPGIMVTGDRATLARAVTNLLTNAWKYTPDNDKRIQLDARAVGARLIEITVADNGVGIPRNEQRHIFDEFERGKHAIRSGTRGVGLGLAFVRAIARAHKGSIEVRSRPGAGSEFVLRIPRRPATAASS